MRLALIAFAALALTTGATFAQEGDATAGEAVFKKCAACHAVGENAKNRVGPVLNGVFGRVAGAMEGFNYSPAMKAKGQEGLAWTHETLTAFLTDPGAYVEGTKMTFNGLPVPEDIANLLAYLQTFSPDYVAPTP